MKLNAYYLEANLLFLRFLQLPYFLKNYQNKSDSELKKLKLSLIFEIFPLGNELNNLLFKNRKSFS
jgi:hypothetical protein